MKITTLVVVKREGVYFVKDPNHPLAGKYFMAGKHITLNVSGPSTVIKKKKNGLFMCMTDKGEQFDYPQNKLKEAISNWPKNKWHDEGGNGYQGNICVTGAMPRSHPQLKPKFDITKHKWSGWQGFYISVDGDFIVMRSGGSINIDDSIAISKHFIHSLPNDDERKSFIDDLLDGVCEHCYSLHLPCYCMKDE